MGLFKRQDSPYWWISYTANGIHRKESTETKDRKIAEAIYAKGKTLIIEDKWFDVD
jgi:hypothetical protein